MTKRESQEGQRKVVKLGNERTPLKKYLGSEKLLAKSSSKIGLGIVHTMGSNCS